MENSTHSSVPTKTVKLPSLRAGITFSFGDYDREGKPQWVIHDSGRNKFFIIGLVEYQLLERWHLGNAELLIDTVNTETTLHVEMEDVENLIKFLANNYLIEQSGYQIFQRAKEQKLFKNDSFLHWLISYYLFFRIPLCHPDHFLDRTRRIGQWVFSRSLGYVMIVLGAIALYQVGNRWEEFTHTFPTVFTWEGLFFYFIAYMVCKLCHELGHAYMCKQYGVPVPSLGVAFLVFWPVLYTDTTLSWSLKSPQRLRIALAGIWVETYITIIAALIWCNVDSLTIQSICYVTIAINWVASLVINVSPFMRFDGYYVFADYLKMPNLQPRAFALTRWQIRKWLFNWADPPPEIFSRKMHNLLVAYSLTTWIYRLIVYFGIAILVYHFFIKAVGIILFAIELFYFILGPLVHEIQIWFALKEKFTFNLHTKITIFIGVLFLLFLLMPLNESIKLPGTLSYNHQFLIAPHDAVLQTPLPAVGTPVKAHQPIVRLYSPDLNQSLREVQLSYQKKLDELRRASIDPSFSSQKSILLSDLNKERAEYKKLFDTYSLFALTVPFNGVVIDVPSEIHPGAAIMKGEWLGDVADLTHAQGEAFVSQIDVSQLKPGLSGYFYPTDASETVVPVKVISIEILNANKLMCHYSAEVKQDKDQSAVVDTPCYNISDFGGQVATFYTDNGDYVPVNSVFRVSVVPTKAVKLNHIERGTIIIKTQPNSYIGRFFYAFKTLWIQQTGF